MLALVADGGMAMVIGFAIKELFRMRGAEWISAQTAGVTVMVAAMHNLIHLSPDLFSMIFTLDYVQLVQTTTEMRSLVLMGYVVPF